MLKNQRYYFQQNLKPSAYSYFQFYNPTQMFTILKPYQSSHQFKRFTSTSYVHRQLQSSLQRASTYSLQVNQNLAKSQMENHALKAIKRPYSENRIYHICSRSNSVKRTPKNSANESKKQIQVPEDLQMVDVLNNKAGFIPQMRDKFEAEIYDKLLLEQKIFELKSKIYEEHKTKDKTNLRNCKLVNEFENSSKNTQILKEQSKQNLTLICILASECSQFDLQVDQTQKMNKKLSKKIDEEQRRVSQLKQQIKNTKIVLYHKTSLVAQLKNIQLIQFKKMTNIYTQMNQLKEQKVRLLTNILTDVQNHS